MTKLPALALAALFLLRVVSLAAAQDSATDFGELERVIQAELKSTNSPGTAIAVVHGDKVVFAKGFGLANVETGEAVTPQMLFRLGSTTKMFTAAAVVSLAEEGSVKLNEPVGGYISGLNAKVARVTPHQLLTHTAGLTDAAPMFGPQDESALAAGVRNWGDDYCFTETGEIFSYSNPGYWLAGVVIEANTGGAFADVLRNRLFQPLGMSRTTFRPLLAMTWPLAQGHEVSAEGKASIIRPASNNAGGWPAGSMYSNVNDLARFCIAFLNDGKLEGKQVLSQELIRQLSTPHVKSPGREGGAYGYGLSIRDDRGAHFVEHGGSRSGYGSFIRFAPTEKFAVIVLINRSAGKLTQTVEKATDLFVKRVAKPQATAAIEKTWTAEEIVRYVGMYTNNRQQIEVVMDEGKLFIKRPNGRQPLVPSGDHLLSTPNGTAVLTRGADGKRWYLCEGGRAHIKRQ